MQRGGVRGHDLLQWKDASRQQRERGAQGEDQGNQVHESSLGAVDVFSFSRIKL